MISLSIRAKYKINIISIIIIIIIIIIINNY